jgi:dUTP pyrophosphatase
MSEVKIKIINTSSNSVPAYETIGAAGMDLRTSIASSVTLRPLQRHLFATGLFIELPIGFEAQVRPRSGMAFKKGITVLNSPGTIDADYRGEVGVILVNLSDIDVTIEPGERIAQMVIAKHERALFEVATELNETSRGSGGFGSTGNK